MTAHSGSPALALHSTHGKAYFGSTNPGKMRAYRGRALQLERSRWHNFAFFYFYFSGDSTSIFPGMVLPFCYFSVVLKVTEKPILFLPHPYAAAVTAWMADKHVRYLFFSYSRPFFWKNRMEYLKISLPLNLTLFCQNNPYAVCLVICEWVMKELDTSCEWDRHELCGTAVFL